MNYLSMPKLKILNSKEIIKILESYGFKMDSQKGSHIKLVKQTTFQKLVLIIADNKNLQKGTIKAIFNQASRFVDNEKLQEYFYSE